MVYYRKYRPQTIEELDLKSVRDRLTSILQAKELPHAFLFTGPKGLGKTSSARILAKAINCEERIADRKSLIGKKETTSDKQLANLPFEPCNKCDVCVSITNGSNIDVLEIDAASNRGIDEIRDLRDKIKYAPAALSKKVYIIDEVHMLTTDAFNALLKTLEEPPSHAVFILATTEVEKVPATIASRTFHVQFAKPTREEILNSLARIVKGEKLEIEPKVLDEIYKLSEGAFRDAAKILEELAISSNNAKITLKTLTSTYKTANLDTEIRNLLENLAKKDLKSSIQIVEEFVNKGADFKIVTERIALNIHDILMLRAGIGSEISDISDFKTDDLKALLNEVNDSYRDIKMSVLPQIPLELVVIDWCLENQNHEARIMNQGKKEEGTALPSEAGSTNHESRITEKKEEEKEKPAEEQIAESSSQAEEKQKEPIHDERPANGEASSNNHGILFSDTSKPDNFLAAFLSSLKQDNHSIAGVLRGCKLIEIGDNEVVFETRFKFHRDKLTEAKSIEILDRRASDLLHQNVKVVVNLIEK